MNRLFAHQLRLLCLLLLFVLGSSPALSSDKPKYCLTDETTHILLIDVTSGFNDRKKAILLEGVNYIRSSQKIGSRLIIQTVEAEFTGSKTLYSECSPHCENSSLFGNCTEGTLRLEKSRQLRKLRSALKVASQMAEQANSDIVRTVVSSLSAPSLAGQNVTTYLFSDMIENSSLINRNDLLLINTEDLVSRLKRSNLVFDCGQKKFIGFGFGVTDSTDSSALNTRELQSVKDFWSFYLSTIGCRDFELYSRLN